jgi:hypothetical protein
VNQPQDADVIVSGQKPLAFFAAYSQEGCAKATMGSILVDRRGKYCFGIAE